MIAKFREEFVEGAHAQGHGEEGGRASCSG